MSEIASAFVRIRPQMAGFKGETESGVRSAFSGIAKIVAGAFAVKAAFDFGKEAVQGAASLQKSMEVIRAEFGQSAEAVTAFGDKAAAKLGISAQVADATSARFGILFKNMGVGQAQAAKMTVGFEQLTGSLSAIRGADPSEVMNKIVLAAAGNTRGLKQLGVAIDQTQIKQEALTLGLIKHKKDALDPGIKAQAIYALATKHLGDFQQQASAHSGDLINVQRRLTAEWSNAKDALGFQLLPAMTHVATFLADVLPPTLSAAQSAIGSFIDQIRNVADIVTPAFAGIRNQLASAHGFEAKVEVVWKDVKDAAGRLATAIQGELDRVNWGAVGHAIVNGIEAGLSATAQIAGKLSGIIEGSLGQIDWERVGTTVGPGVAAAIVSALKTILDPGFWARHWEEMLSIALAVIPVGRLAELGGRIVGAVARPILDLFGPTVGRAFAAGGNAILAVAERLPARLGSLFLDAVLAIPPLFARLAALVGAELEKIPAAITAKLGTVKTILLKTLAFDAVIHAVEAAIRSIVGLFERMWRDIERAGLSAAAKVIEPFSHIPGPAGAWARKAKDAIQVELSNINLQAFVAKVGAQFDANVGKMPAFGHKHAQSWLQGFVQHDLSIPMTGKLHAALTSVTAGASGSAASGGSTIGGSLAAGMSAGVIAGGAAVAAAVAATVQQAVAAGQAAARAKSPSQETKDKIGKPLGEGVIEGFLEGTGTLPAKVSATIRTALEAGRKEVETAQSSFSTAFGNLATIANMAFDSVTSQIKTPAERLLEKMQRADAVNQLKDALKQANDQVAQAQQAVTAAQNAAPTEDPVQAQANVKALVDARSQLQGAEKAKTDAERAIKEDKLQQEAVKQRKHEDQILALRRLSFQNQLTALQDSLAKEGATHDKAQKEILALYKKYGIQYQGAGRAIGDAIAAGLRSASNEVASAADHIAQIIADHLKLRSPAKVGPLSDLNTWWQGMVPTLLQSLGTGGLAPALAAGLSTGIGGTIGPLRTPLDGILQVNQRMLTELERQTDALATSPQTGQGGWPAVPGGGALEVAR